MTAKPAEDVLAEIGVHLALTPDWDSETLEGVVEALGSAHLPSVGDMTEVEYWTAEAKRLGVWEYYRDGVMEWAEDERRIAGRDLSFLDRSNVRPVTDPE